MSLLIHVLKCVLIVHCVLSKFRQIEHDGRHSNAKSVEDHEHDDKGELCLLRFGSVGTMSTAVLVSSVLRCKQLIGWFENTPLTCWNEFDCLISCFGTSKLVLDTTESLELGDAEYGNTIIVLET